MSPNRSQAAIRFVLALFLAQTFVNAVALPNPHLHQVLDARQVVSLPVVPRQETVEPDAKNVFDAIIDTLKGYDGWQVFQDFFRKLFSGPAPEEIDDGETVPPVVVVPVPDASVSPVDVISVIESIISEVASATKSGYDIPLVTDTPVISESDGIISILPIWPIDTAIDLSFTGEPAIPTELLSEGLPEATDIPVVVIVPPIDANSTDVGIALPTEILPPIVTGPIVTGPVVILPVPTETPLFPIENGTAIVSLPGTDVPVIVVIPTAISDPLEFNATVSAGISATADASIGLDINATISLPTTIDLTVTIEPTLIGTGVGTALPITISVDAPYVNVTEIVVPTLILSTGTGDIVGTIVPTLVVDPISAPFANATGIVLPSLPLVTGTGDIGTILPTVAVDPISAPFANATGIAVPSLSLVTGTGDIGTILPTIIVEPISVPLPNLTAVAPIETSAIVIGTGILGTGIVSIEPIATLAPIGTGLPAFPNTTVEIVIEPTFVLPDGTAPIISALPLPSSIDNPIFANTTTTTIFNIITPTIPLLTGVEVTAPAGTIIVVPGPDVVFPNITITVNGSEATLPIALPTINVEPTAVPEITIDLSTLAPVIPVETEFPAIPVVTISEPVVSPNATIAPVETELPVISIIPIIPIDPELPTGIALPIETEAPEVTVIGPIILPIPTDIPVETIDPEAEPIPTDAPVVEFPGEPILPTLPAIELPAPEETTPAPVESTPVASTPVESTPVVVTPIIPIETIEPVEVTAPVVPIPEVTPVPLPFPLSVEFPAEPTPDIVVPVIPVESIEPVEEPAEPTFVVPVIPVPSVEPVAEPSTTLVVPVSALTLSAETTAPTLPSAPVAVSVSVAASASISASVAADVSVSVAPAATSAPSVAIPVVPVVPVAPATTLIPVVSRPTIPAILPFSLPAIPSVISIPSILPLPIPTLPAVLPLRFPPQ